jgi:hypothetical protein
MCRFQEGTRLARMLLAVFTRWRKKSAAGQPTMTKSAFSCKLVTDFEFSTIFDFLL